jgi:hypothetical protein
MSDQYAAAARRRADGRTPKLANPDSPQTRAALRNKCPLCGANPHTRCTNPNGHPLRARIVHYARAQFRPQETI